MSYINVGAVVNGNTKPKKGELVKAMKEDPTTVTFYVTGDLGPYGGQSFRGDAVPDGFKLSVVGPDPYRKRDWYSTVELHRDRQGNTSWRAK